MIEIVVGIWVLSLLMSAVTVGINFYLTLKKLNSAKLHTLNLNLAKVGMFWSNSLGNFAPLIDDSVQKDRDKTLRNSVLIGLLGIAGIIGYLLLLALVLSLHLIAKSRREVAVFHSDLTSDSSLTENTVRAKVGELSQVY